MANDANEFQPRLTADGIHVLGYIGENTWIEADPGIHKVIKVKTPADDNIWFTVPVSVMRWRQLE
jgi:hypothetical protein